MARKNPTISKATPNDQVLEGVDRLPNPVGVNMKALEDAEQMPDVSMKTNDGDNPSVADAPFATGKDVRAYDNRGTRSNPYPAMPGANS